MDEAVSQLEFSTLTGKTVFFDSQYLDVTVDRGYLVSSLRQHLLASGCILKEDRAKLGAEPAGRVNYQVDRFRLDRQPLDMGDVAAALDGEEEARGRLLRPANKALPRRLPIEGVIELDRVELPGVEGELLARRELLGIEALTPVRI